MTELEAIYRKTDELIYERDELRRQNAELRECLKVKDEALAILAHYKDVRPQWMFPDIQECARKALAAQPEGGAK